MNTAPLFFSPDGDTLSAEEKDLSIYHPLLEIAEDAPASNTQTINISDSGPVVYLPANRVERYFMPEQSWEGMVLEVCDGSFRARLIDMKNADQEEAEILNTAVTDQDDLKLLSPGAIFFWTIGHRVERRRSEQVSLIQFRRLPVWTDKEIQQAEMETMAIKKKLGW